MKAKVLKTNAGCLVMFEKENWYDNYYEVDGEIFKIWSIGKKLYLPDVPKEIYLVKEVDGKNF